MSLSYSPMYYVRLCLHPLPVRHNKPCDMPHAHALYRLYHSTIEKGSMAQWPCPFMFQNSKFHEHRQSKSRVWGNINYIFILNGVFQLNPDSLSVLDLDPPLTWGYVTPKESLVALMISFLTVKSSFNLDIFSCCLARSKAACLFCCTLYLISSSSLLRHVSIRSAALNSCSMMCNFPLFLSKSMTRPPPSICVL